MFSWKKNPKEQQSVGRNAKQNSLDNMDFSDLLKDPVDSFGTEDGGDDMDPDLLRQLQELSSSSAPRKSKPKAKEVPNIDPADIDEYARLAQDEDIEVDFDENDMNDPNLLSELSLLHDSGPDVAEVDPAPAKPLPAKAREQNASISFTKIPMNDSHKTARSLPPNDVALQLMAMGFSQRQAMDALQRNENDLERATNYLLDSPATSSEGTDDKHDNGDTIAPGPEIPTQHLQQLIDTNSDTIEHSKNDARQKTSKLMEPLEPVPWSLPKDGDNLEHDAPLTQKTIPAPTQTTYDNVQFEPERLDQPKFKAEAELGSEEDFEIKNNETDISLLTQYASEYQKAAVSAKRSGDKALAVDLLRKSKLFSARKEELKELQSDDASFTEEASIGHRAVTTSSLGETDHRTEAIQTQTPEVSSQEQDAPSIPTPAVPAKDPVQQPIRDEQPTGRSAAEISTPKSNNSGHSDSNSSKPTTTTLLQPEVRQPSLPPAVPASDTSEIQTLLETLIVRQKEYKQAAIHYKNIGNLVAAKDMIRVSKEVLQAAVAVKNGQMTSVYSIKTKIPKAPDMDLGSGKPRQIQEVDVMSTVNLPDFSQLEMTLSYQVDICHNLELQNRGKAGGNVNLGESFKGLAKAFAADIASLKSAENSNGSLPRFHYQNVSYAYRETNPDIGSNEMVISISKATQLQSLEAAVQDIEAYVQWDLGGWPPENVPQAHLGKGQTPSASKGGNPVFDFKTSIPITRHNRAYMRYLQRKKTTFEVYHKRYSYGFLPRPLFLGKVTVDMSQLLNNASTGGVLELVDLNKKKTGAMLHVNISLSEPLSNTDIPTKQEKWLIIDEFNANIYPLLASAQLIPQSMAHYQPARPASPQINALPPPHVPPKTGTEDRSTKQTSPLPQADNPVQPEENAPKLAHEGEESEFEKAEADFNNVDAIVSNMVLENEIGLINAAISACHGTVPDDLMDQKQALEIKMNMLVIQVQTGGLSIEQYLANVKARIEQDKKCALTFKRAGRLDLAKQALRRKKIAQDEVDEAEAAMAQQAEEEQ